MYTTGSPLSDTEVIPRMRIIPPSPTVPEARFIVTPAERPWMSWSTLVIGAFATMSAALTVEIELPSLRRAVSTPEPVTTISSRLIARSVSTKSAATPCPTVTVTWTSSGPNPMMSARMVSSPAGALGIR